MKKTSVPEAVEESLYDSDFFTWTQRIAESVRSGHLSDEDREHVAEEIADMGKRDRRELRSRMTVLLMHLMKWAAQPKLRDKSTWKATIVEQRHQINDLLADSPSLRVHLIEELPILYSRAAFLAADETKMSPTEFMRPYAFVGNVAHIDRLLSDLWVPGQMDDLFNGGTLPE
jgi:Domain of unknown function DUF29